MIGRAVIPVPLAFVTLCNYWHYGVAPPTLAGLSEPAKKKSGQKKKKGFGFLG